MEETRRPIFSARRPVRPAASGVDAAPAAPSDSPTPTLPLPQAEATGRPTFGRPTFGRPTAVPAPGDETPLLPPDDDPERFVATPPAPVAIESTADVNVAAPIGAAPRPRFGSGRGRDMDVDGPSSGSDFGDDNPGTAGRAEDAVTTEEIAGRLDSLRTINDWAVGTIWTEDRKQLKITGTGLADLSEGFEYLFVGFNKPNTQYGDSFEVVAATPHISSNPMAITHFIAGSYKGIGLAKADKYVKAILELHGDVGLEDLRQRLINDPSSVDLTALAANAAYRPKGTTADDGSGQGLGRQSVVFRDLATRLTGTPGMKANVFKALAIWLVEKNGPYEGSSIPLDLAPTCWGMLVQDPYTPMAEVEGYAWHSAEAIGRAVGVPRDLPRRLSALAQYALQVGCEGGGHAYLTASALAVQISKLDPQVQPAAAIAQAVTDGFLVDDETGRIYSPTVLKAEMRLAAGIADLLAPVRPLTSKDKASTDRQIAEVASALGFEKGLDPSQVDAVSSIIRSPVRVHTLIGGPGCGKTTVMEVLAKMLPGKEIVFATPTGKAAKVLHARVKKHSLSAATLHSTLECRGDTGFARGPDNQLDADVFVIDESSMPDIELMDAAVAAMRDGSHVVFVGDPEQLPSIGPGRVLKDLLTMEGIDHNRLNTTHRNSGGILNLVNSCRKGRLDLTDTHGVSFSHGLGDASKQIGHVAAVYTDAVARLGFENVILLMSRRKGEAETPGWNTTYANAILRDICNPHAEKITSTSLYVGDRVIIRKNMVLEQRGEDGEPDGQQTERVVNGDVGTIRGITNPRKSSGVKSLLPQWADIELDDGRLVNLQGHLLGTLGHAYALTVHAAQGSEYKEVILVATPGHSTFVNRAMLLTGLSRPRDQIRVFANDDDLAKIAATPVPSRNTALVERVEAAKTSRDMDAPPPQRMRV